MNDLEIMDLLIRAKEAGVTMDDVEAFKARSVKSHVPDVEAKDIVQPLSTFEEMDAELVQYWATPYADEIIARREAQMKKAKGEIE